MEKIKELFKRIWDWIKGAGRKIVAVAASILSLLFIGKIFSNKKSKRDILKKEIKDLKKEIKDGAREVENKIKSVEASENLVKETLEKTDVDSRKKDQASKKADLKDILPDL